MRKKVVAAVIFTLLVACRGTGPRLKQTLSVRDLTAEYGHSKSSVRQKYDGKEISVQGYVLVPAAAPKDGEHEGFITLEEKTGSSSVLCWFTRAKAAEFTAIERDRLLTVRGVFNGERGAELKFCRLVDIE